MNFIFDDEVDTSIDTSIQPSIQPILWPLIIDWSWPDHQLFPAGLSAFPTASQPRLILSSDQIPDGQKKFFYPWEIRNEPKMSRKVIKLHKLVQKYLDKPSSRVLGLRPEEQDISQNNNQDIKEKQQIIKKKMLANFKHKGGLFFTEFNSRDLNYLFKLYDQTFFKGLITEILVNQAEMPDAIDISFKANGRLKKSAGQIKYKRTRGQRNQQQIKIEFSISKPLILNLFEDDQDSVLVNGILAEDKITVLQTVFEHEIVHLVLYLLDPNADQPINHKMKFRTLVKKIFGHTDYQHNLILPGSAKNRPIHTNDVKKGDRVSLLQEEKGKWSYTNPKYVVYKRGKRNIVITNVEKPDKCGDHRFLVPPNYLKVKNQNNQRNNQTKHKIGDIVNFCTDLDGKGLGGTVKKGIVTEKKGDKITIELDNGQKINTYSGFIYD